MKTILVLAGGSDSDAAVFATALAVARPLGAHLEFLHIWLSAGEAAAYIPHLEFARGSGLLGAMERLRTEAAKRSAAAQSNFRKLCERQAIEILDTACRFPGVSAAWREERDDAVERMLRHARHNDLVIIGRPPRANGLPPDLVERLLVGSGRPVLVAPPQPRGSVTGTTLVFWNETAAAARALGAARPLLLQSERVMILRAGEEAAGSLDDVRDLAERLAWHGIAAECNWLQADARAAPERLEAAAAHYDADLVVMGGYSRSRAREAIFGGCTQHFLDHAKWPVLMMH